jgi:peptidoglycan/LPS O-acetylase OafA/YrhL
MQRRKVYTLIFIALLSVYLINLYLKVNLISVHWFVRNYLNDLLCLPLVLFGATWVLRIYFKQPKLQLDKWKILFALIVFSVVFEVLAPEKYLVHTGDPWDVFCYVVGAFAFWLTQKYEFRKALVSR